MNVTPEDYPEDGDPEFPDRPGDGLDSMTKEDGDGNMQHVLYDSDANWIRCPPDELYTDPDATAEPKSF